MKTLPNLASTRRGLERRVCSLITGTALALALIVSSQAVFADNNRPAGDPSSEGQWSDPFDLGVIAINAALLQTGKVLFWQFQLGGDGGSEAELWDPSGTLKDVTVPYDVDVFCGGQTHLADGRIMVLGGVVWGAAGSEVGVTNTNFFDVTTETWSAGPQMSYPRWYPDVIEAGDGSVFAIGGQQFPGLFVYQLERYDPITNTITTLPSSADIDSNNYARTLVLPDGRIFMAAQISSETDVLDLTTNTWSFAGDTNFGPRLNGQAVLLPDPNKVLVIGGGPGVEGEATSSCEIIDFSDPVPSWRYTGSMTYPRQYGNSVLLADGTVMAIGGCRSGKYIDPAGPAEIYDPATETWTVMAAAPVYKCHHSTAVLLPDGRVWSAGGDGYIPMRTFGQIFSPPYLFRGPQPVVTRAPTTVTYNRSFTVGTPDAANIAHVALVKLGTATHAGNFDQRYADLTFRIGNGKLHAKAPADANLAPPGYYMLFIITTDGVPSIAPMVLLQ